MFVLKINNQSNTMFYTDITIYVSYIVCACDTACFLDKHEKNFFTTIKNGLGY